MNDQVTDTQLLVGELALELGQAFTKYLSLHKGVNPPQTTLELTNEHKQIVDSYIGKCIDQGLNLSAFNENCKAVGIKQDVIDLIEIRLNDNLL